MVGNCRGLWVHILKQNILEWTGTGWSPDKDRGWKILYISSVLGRKMVDNGFQIVLKGGEIVVVWGFVFLAKILSEES